MSKGHLAHLLQFVIFSSNNVLYISTYFSALLVKCFMCFGEAFGPRLSMSQDDYKTLRMTIMFMIVINTCMDTNQSILTFQLNVQLAKILPQLSKMAQGKIVSIFILLKGSHCRIPLCTHHTIVSTSNIFCCLNLPLSEALCSRTVYSCYLS